MMAATLFLIRHAIAITVVTGCLCIGWTIIYFALFLLAILTNSGLGSPLSYPITLVFLLISSLVICGGIFAPSCGMGALICYLAKWPRLVSIPFTFVAALALSYLAYWFFIFFVTTHSMPPAVVILQSFLLYLSIPLGVYWWVTEGLTGAFRTFLDYSAKRLSRIL